MAFIKESEAGYLEAISELSYCNPFVPERIELERRLLGDRFEPEAPVWSWTQDQQQDRPNIAHLSDRLEQFATDLRSRMMEGAKASDRELLLYEDLIFFMLYHRYRLQFHETIIKAVSSGSSPKRFSYWKSFEADWHHFYDVPGFRSAMGKDAAHLFACLFQLRRAFYYIFHYIVGGSAATARLRTSVWQSIFTHDMRRCCRTLFLVMGDITTLITGPSGTGKELVARAVGHARYIPFDAAAESFTEDFVGSFHPLNLTAMSPTLIESELFGHKRGAFTGASADKIGWLEVCTQLGTVFLDEIGETDVAIQVKLLRVIQTRRFNRLGDTSERAFDGKLIAATNLDLGSEMQAGRFREDFYYRLCSDMIRTPSLHEQIVGQPAELRRLIDFMSHRIVGDDAPTLCDEVEAWIDGHLGSSYMWPGNIRELEQCVRNVLIRKEYHPATQGRNGMVDGPRAAFAQEVSEASLDAEELLNRYCTLMMAETGSYVEAARRLGIDRRTVKARIDETLLEQFRSSGA
jgi:sigma-54 specific flagellar transcriptional regulator A